jgi:hypothetical protein
MVLELVKLTLLDMAGRKLQRACRRESPGPGMRSRLAASGERQPKAVEPWLA